MSQYKDLISFIDGVPQVEEHAPQEEQRQGVIPANPFDIIKFADELQQRSENKKRGYASNTQNINAYDVAHNCIRQIVYKLSGTPVKSYADKWLPVLLRTTLGNAVHDFIQKNTNQMTEQEVSLKVPSIRFSGRCDGLIGNNILVEIKSMPFDEYEKAIKTGNPRKQDALQAILYTYILENYLDEIKQPQVKVRPGTEKPKLDKYKINLIQFIYVAHDLMSSDMEDFGRILKTTEAIKKRLNSKKNKFYFMTSIGVDLAKFDISTHVNYIKSKIQRINYYVDSNTLPPEDDEFINKNCFFCLYKDICDIV